MVFLLLTFFIFRNWLDQYIIEVFALTARTYFSIWSVRSGFFCRRLGFLLHESAGTARKLLSKLQHDWNRSLIVALYKLNVWRTVLWNMWKAFGRVQSRRWHQVVWIWYRDGNLSSVWVRLEGLFCLKQKNYDFKFSHLGKDEIVNKARSFWHIKVLVQKLWTTVIIEWIHIT